MVRRESEGPSPLLRLLLSYRAGNFVQFRSALLPPIQYSSTYLPTYIHTLTAGEASEPGVMNIHETRREGTQEQSAEKEKGIRKDGRPLLHSIHFYSSRNK